MKRNLLWSFCLLLITSAAFSQQQMQNISQKFKNYRGVAFQEKLFVHIDQDFYLTGELLWFRVFCVDGTLHKPSSISKVAFVEILDRNNRPMLQAKVPLEDGNGHGSLFLPATFNSGSYVVRMYTQWMRNFSPDFYFHKQISVVNPFFKPENPPAKATPKINVELFPEGGNLVAGLRSRIGFKVTDSDGRPVSGKGYILQNGSDTVGILLPERHGLGSFHITPSPDAQYSCAFTDETGVKGSVGFPKVYEEGYSVQLIDSAANAVMVRVRYKGNQSNLRQSFLFGHSRQSIVFAEAKPLYPNEAVYTIAREKLPDGITHFTVFDENEKPVCERLYFKAPANPMSVRITSDQASYATRRKVSLDVSVVAGTQAIPADVSLAVYRVDSLSSATHDDILSYLYLESDLKGKIDSAAFYFSDADGARVAADNLMLTHGWRRFKWENVLKGDSTLSFIPEVRSHLITGKVTRADGKPAPGILTYLSSPGKLVNLYGARSGKDGLVHFEVRDFWGSRQLIMQTNTSVDSTYTLSVNNPYDESVSSVATKPFLLSPSMKDKLGERSLSMQVQDIFYREVNDRIVAVKNDSTAFFGNADETYNLDDYTRFPVMEEVMREYVPGVLVRKRRSGFHFLVIDKVNRGILEGDPLVLLDGMPVFDVDKIMSFDPLRIKKLEVVTRNFYVGPLFLPGIVSYSTYTGDLAGFEIDPRSVVINYEGLQLQREFYSPAYGNQKDRSNRLPDQRTLLHWIPQLKIDAAGAKKVEFYTSDLSGDFVVVVHALARKGMAGTGVHKFTVKRADF